MSNSPAVFKLYKSVIDDVITNVREAFLDDGVDEHVLQELKQIWESKLMLTRAVDPTPLPLPKAGVGRQGKSRAGTSSTESPQMQAQLQLQAAAAEAQKRTAAAVGSNVIQQQSTQAFQIPGTTTQLSSSAAAATLAFQQSVLQLPHQLTSLPAGLTLAQPVTQTFPAYTLSQPHGALQAGPYQAVLPTGQTVMIHPTPQAAPTQQQQQQQQQSEQAGGSISLTKVQARVLQVDGTNDTSDEDDDDDEEEDNENEDNEDNEDFRNDMEENPLNSDDDVSDEDPTELFEAEHVVVCQYDKINRSRNKWKFHLKNGIMNLNGRDYVFFKAGGDAEW